jgi:hypothetical protein
VNKALNISPLLEDALRCNCCGGTDLVCARRWRKEKNKWKAEKINIKEALKALRIDFHKGKYGETEQAIERILVLLKG